MQSSVFKLCSVIQTALLECLYQPGKCVLMKIVVDWFTYILLDAIKHIRDNL